MAVDALALNRMLRDADGCREMRGDELAGQRIIVLGRTAIGSRRDLSRLVRQHGGELISPDDRLPTLVVLGDEHRHVDAALAQLPAESAERLIGLFESGVLALASESQLWQRLGLVDDGRVRRLYTPALLAEMLGVPLAAVRHWHRQGALHAAWSVGRLSYFDFHEAAVGRQLAELYQSGCSLRTIDRQLAELARRLPGVERPLADPAVVVEGRRVSIRRDEGLAEPGGQLLLDFAEESAAPDDEESNLLAWPTAAATDAASPSSSEPVVSGAVAAAQRLQQEALDAEEDGRLGEAAEAYRAALMAGGPNAEWQFALADVLYRRGDLSAARERYYAALEIDEEYVEARCSLGCVLAETGELELAAATFAGALRYHADFADAHFHLAQTLDRLGRSVEAHRHFQSFLALAPESPWADAARDRLERTRGT